MPVKHSILGGEAYIYLREGSPYWQAATFLEGRNLRISTKEDSLARAKDVATDWYLGLKGLHRRGEIKKNEKTFREAAEHWEREFKLITEGQRNPGYVHRQVEHLRVYLIPFFGELGLSEVTAGKIQDYRIWRREKAIAKHGKPPARSTIHHEIVVLRQTLKCALRHRWLDHIPDFSEPYRASGKVSHRAWFSKDEYKRLYEATRARAQKPKNNRFRWECEQLHDLVLFVANSGVRPDEAKRLQFRDVEIVHDADTDEVILQIQVRGKRGVGYCKSTTGAVPPFRRLQSRLRPLRLQPDSESEDECLNIDVDGQNDNEDNSSWSKPESTELIFPRLHRGLFNTVLDELNLKTDREGQRRTLYSLRHTYICFRLLEGADIYQIAKNCRTSVEMIEKFYAAHIATSLDASAINVRRDKPQKAVPRNQLKRPRQVRGAA